MKYNGEFGPFQLPRKTSSKIILPSVTIYSLHPELVFTWNYLNQNSGDTTFNQPSFKLHILKIHTYPSPFRKVV